MKCIVDCWIKYFRYTVTTTNSDGLHCNGESCEGGWCAVLLVTVGELLHGGWTCAQCEFFKFRYKCGNFSQKFVWEFWMLGYHITGSLQCLLLALQSRGMGVWDYRLTLQHGASSMFIELYALRAVKWQVYLQCPALNLIFYIMMSFRVVVILVTVGKETVFRYM
jgi:hypothetical protein